MIDEWRGLREDLVRQKGDHFRDCKRSKYSTRIPKWACVHARHACCKGKPGPGGISPCQTTYHAALGETFVNVWHPAPKKADKRAGRYSCDKVAIFDPDNGCFNSYRAFTDSSWTAPVQGDSCALDGDDDDDDETGDDDEDGEGGEGGGNAGNEEDEAEREEAEREEAAGEGQ